MSKPRNGVATVAVAIVLAAAGGGLLSRSLRPTGAAPVLATEATVLVLLNQQRAAHRLPPLALDRQLTRVATSHSADMMRRGYFAHDGPEVAWDVRIRREVKRAVVGEILEFGAGKRRTASGMVKAWMQSPPHRRVILTRDLRLIGIGIVTGTFRGQEDTAMVTGDLSSR